jgi:hypothetical protein
VKPAAAGAGIVDRQEAAVASRFSVFSVGAGIETQEVSAGLASMIVGLTLGTFEGAGRRYAFLLTGGNGWKERLPTRSQPELPALAFGSLLRD